MATGKSMKSIVMRAIVVLSFMIAAIIMFIAHEKVCNAQFATVSVKYLDWDAFLLCVVVDCIGCVYNLIVLLIPGGSQLWKTVIVLDVIVDIVVVGSLGAGWQTYSLVKKGNTKAAWCSICSVVPIFCNKLLASLIVSTTAFFFSILLL
ncbi:CASP-like protein RCOM_1174750, partial [Striga asiatica]